MGDSGSNEVLIDEIDSNDVPENKLEQFQETEQLRVVDIIDCDADGGERQSFVADEEEGALIKRYVHGVQCLEFPDFCTKLEASDEAATASGNVEMPSTSAQAKPAQEQSSGSGRSGEGGGFRRSQLSTALQGLMGEANQDEAPAPVNEPGSGRLSSSIIAEMANLYQADRQNSLRVPRNQVQSRKVFDNSDFVALEYLILPQSSPTPEEVVENIRHDFCSSPTYVEDEDVLPCDSPPWFRFRKKTIKTYSRMRVPDKEDLRLIVGNDVQDRLSCSSGLFVQEDLNTTSTSAICDLDVNTSPNISENQYFSMDSTASYPNIDLPSMARQDSEKPSCYRELQNGLLESNSSSECTYTEIENINGDLQNVFQICSFKPQGTLGDTLFGDSMRTTTISHSRWGIKCDDGFETDSNVKDYSTENITELSELDDIPISEWLIEMDFPENSVEESKEPKKKIPEEEEFVGFRTASDKPIQVSEEMQKRAEKLLAGFEAAETHQPKIEHDYKDSKIEKTPFKMKRKAAKLMAEAGEINQPILKETKNESEFVGFRTASNKLIVNADVAKEATSKKIPTCDDQQTGRSVLNKRQAKENKEFFEFRTASKIRIEMPEEMRKKTVKLIENVHIVPPLDNAENQKKPSKSYDQISLEKLHADDNLFSMDEDSNDTVFHNLSQINKKKLEYRDDSSLVTPKCKRESNSPQQYPPQYPPKSQEIYGSLSKREALSPLDKSSQTFVISSRNLLTGTFVGNDQSGLYQPSQGRNSRTQECSGYHSQVMGTSDFQGFRTTSNKLIEKSPENRKADKLIEEIVEINQPIVKETKNKFSVKLLENVTPLDISENLRKPSNSSDQISLEKIHADDIFFSADEDSNDTPLFLSQINPNRLEYRDRDDSSVVTPKCERERNSPQQNPSQRSRLHADDIFFSGDEESNDTVFLNLSQINPNRLEYGDDSSVVTPNSNMKKNSPQHNLPQGILPGTSPDSPRFAPSPTSTSTPLAKANYNLAKDPTKPLT